MSENSGLVPQSINIEALTIEDFNNLVPFEYLWGMRDREFEQHRSLSALKTKAEELGYRDFATLWQKYQKQERQRMAKSVGNIAAYDWSDLVLGSGPWICTDGGIWIDGDKGDLVACSHPIIPVQRLRNIDTGTEKIRLMFKRGDMIRNLIVDKTLVASSQSIIKLADMGVGVTSESSKLLVKYIADIEAINYEQIPTGQCIGHVGWHGDSFVPYDENITFDGEASHKQIYDSISQKGTLTEWVEKLKEVRKTAPLATRIMLAASFASVLVDIVNALPFYVHIWGKSGKGKTVALMMAASVWGNPDNDAYLQSFNGTQNSLEGLAGFFNSLPLILDESQLQKTQDGRIAVNVYKLSDGSSKGRMTRTLGSQAKLRWRNCILTSGEQPLTDSSSGGGALNRVISICADNVEDGQLFDDAPGFVDFIHEHYGQAGKAFVEFIQDYGTEKIKQAYQMMRKYLESKQVTEKQSMAGAIIMVADMLTNMEYFQDGTISIDEMAEFLATREEASQEQRQYELLLDWIEINSNGFEDYAVKRHGFKKQGICYIYKKSFDEFCREVSCNSEVLLRWLKHNDKTKTNGDRTTFVVREGNKSTLRMVAVYLSEDSETV